MSHLFDVAVPVTLSVGGMKDVSGYEPEQLPVVLWFAASYPSTPLARLYGGDEEPLGRPERDVYVVKSGATLEFHFVTKASTAQRAAAAMRTAMEQAIAGLRLGAEVRLPTRPGQPAAEPVGLWGPRTTVGEATASKLGRRSLTEVEGRMYVYHDVTVHVRGVPGHDPDVFSRLNRIVTAPRPDGARTSVFRPCHMSTTAPDQVAYTFPILARAGTAVDVGRYQVATAVTDLGTERESVEVGHIVAKPRDPLSQPDLGNLHAVHGLPLPDATRPQAPARLRGGAAVPSTSARPDAGRAPVSSGTEVPDAPRPTLQRGPARRPR